MKGGVYAIRCYANGKVYIGSSANVKSRVASHYAALYRGQHQCRVMQEDWDTYGEERFCVSVLHVGDGASDLARRERAKQMEYAKVGLLYNRVRNPASKRVKQKRKERQAGSDDLLETWMREMEALAKDKGLKPRQFLQRAGMDLATWSHWKRMARDNTKGPSLKCALRVEQVIREYRPLIRMPEWDE